MAASDPAARPWILVVDDEVPLLNVMRQMLQIDFNVDTAVNTEEATALARLRRYDVMVCDHMLVGEQGLDFLIRMAEEQPHTARILLTGYMNPELISRSVAVAGLAVCLIKPVSHADLVKAVRAALERPRAG